MVSALFCWPCNISMRLSPSSVVAGALVVSALFRWPCSVSEFVFHACRGWCQLFSAGHVAFLFICLRPEVCHCWCPPFSAGDATFPFIPQASLPLRMVSQFFLKMCPPFLSLLVSAHFRWPCSISIRLSSFVFKMISLLLSPGFGACTAGIRPFPLASISIHLSPTLSLYFPKQVTVRFLRVSALLPPSVRLVSLGLPSCWSLCPPSCWAWSPFCFLLFPFLLVIVSALSPFLSPFVSGLVSLLVGHCVHLVSLLFPFFSLLVSLLVGHCVRLVSLLSPLSPFLSPFLLVTVSVLSPFCFLLSPFLLVIVSALSPFLSPFVSGLVSLLVGHCVRLVSLLFPLPSCLPCCPHCHLSPCVYICLPALDCCVPLPCNRLHLSRSAGLLCPPQSLFYICLPALTAVSASALQSFACVLASLCICLPALDCCIRLCLAILYLSPSWAACLQSFTFVSLRLYLSPSSGRRKLCSDFEKHNLFGVYGGVIFVRCNFGSQRSRRILLKRQLCTKDPILAMDPR